MKEQRIERVATVMLAAAALILATLSARRQLSSPAPRRRAPEDSTLRYDARWKQFADSGILMGSLTAEVTLTEFADLECPFCARVQPSIDSLLTRYGSRVNYVFVHLPLPSHRFAVPAARASECAAEQHRFREFVTVLFAGQDSLGLRPMSSYAVRAGLRDTARFSRCNALSGVPPRIAAGQHLAAAVSVLGTPTFFINGWRMDGATGPALAAVVDSVLAGQKLAR